MTPPPNEAQMAQLVREFDWGATALGPQAAWPPELKTAVSFVLESHFPMAIVWGPGQVTIYNDAFRPILGDKPEALGRSFADVWSEVWSEIEPMAARAFAGEATYLEDFPLLIDRSGRPEEAWFTFCYSPLRLADGTVAGMMDTVVETTSTVRTRADLKVLNEELRHRLKNTLTIVQALARGSLKRGVERPAFDALLDRIVAMGAAHDVLFRVGWTSATVDEVARATLALALERIDIEEGPEVRIGAQAAVALSLVLHELASNAAKHGSLSAPTGRVALSWRVDTSTDIFTIHWREMGGPAARPPTRAGFGSRLINMGLSPRGTVSLRYPTSGFEADLETPVGALLAG
jgi:two-component sensor histidine kinase